MDNEQQRILLWFHGWWTDGTRWPIGAAQARDWAAKNGYGQYSQVAESSDGLRFDIKPAITKAGYLRVFRVGGAWYGMSRAGVLRRASGPLAPFEPGPNPFRDTAFTTRLRHVALLERGGVMYVFFTVVGDAPERVMVSTLSTSGDWKDWRLSPATEVLRPEAPYECTNLPNVPSEGGDIKGPAQQIRDPYAFSENGRAYLFYSYCGEQGIAAAELTFP